MSFLFSSSGQVFSYHFFTNILMDLDGWIGGTDVPVDREEEMHLQGCTFDPCLSHGIFQEESSPTSLTSIGGMHSVVIEYLGTGPGQTLVTSARPKEQSAKGPKIRRRASRLNVA